MSDVKKFWVPRLFAGEKSFELEHDEIVLSFFCLSFQIGEYVFGINRFISRHPIPFQRKEEKKKIMHVIPIGPRLHRTNMYGSMNVEKREKRRRKHLFTTHRKETTLAHTLMRAALGC